MLGNSTFIKIFQQFPSPGIVLLPDAPVFTIVEVNLAYLVARNVEREDVIGKGFFDFVKEHSNSVSDAEIQAFCEALQNKQKWSTAPHCYNIKIKDKSGFEERYFQSENELLLNDEDGVTHIIHTITDVTETVLIKEKEARAEQSLRETSLLMQQGQELANFGNWQWDVVKNKVSWSETLYAIYGLDKTSFKATFEGYQELLHPDDRAYVYNTISSVLQTKQDVVFEERIVRPNGELRYLKSWGKVQTDEQNNPVKMIGACLDITETKIAEAQLTQMHKELEEHLKTLAISEKRYSDLFHLSPLPMWVFNLDSRKFLNVNSAAIKHYGYTLDEFLTMDVTRMWPIDCLHDFEQTVNSTSQMYSGISTQSKKNGEKIKVFLQSNFIQFSGENTHLVVATDITERQNYIQAIELQNKHLQDIAWMQSHVIRAPLARIMGLIEVFKNYDAAEIDKNGVLADIEISAQELDGVIKHISTKTDEVASPLKI